MSRHVFVAVCWFATGFCPIDSIKFVFVEPAAWKDGVTAWARFTMFALLVSPYLYHVVGMTSFSSYLRVALKPPAFTGPVARRCLSYLWLGPHKLMQRGVGAECPGSEFGNDGSWTRFQGGDQEKTLLIAKEGCQSFSSGFMWSSYIPYQAQCRIIDALVSTADAG